MTNNRPGPRLRHAFTLVELLVVVAVIALLMGLLLPALSKARFAAKTMVCLSNMRNMELAQLVYANDHDGQLVDYGYSHGGGALDVKASWFNTLQEYYDTPLVARSPVDTSPYWPPSQGGSGRTVPGSVGQVYRQFSYGLNEYVTPHPSFDPAHPNRLPADNLRKVKNPSATIQFVIMAFEGAFAGADHVHSSDWWIGDFAPDSPPVQAASQVQTNAHGGPEKSWESKSNYAFLDGHALTLPFREVYTSPTVNNFDPYLNH